MMLIRDDDDDEDFCSVFLVLFCYTACLCVLCQISAVRIHFITMGDQRDKLYSVSGSLPYLYLYLQVSY